MDSDDTANSPLPISDSDDSEDEVPTPIITRTITLCKTPPPPPVPSNLPRSPPPLPKLTRTHSLRRILFKQPKRIPTPAPALPARSEKQEEETVDSIQETSSEDDWDTLGEADPAVQDDTSDSDPDLFEDNDEAIELVIDKVVAPLQRMKDYICTIPVNRSIQKHVFYLYFEDKDIPFKHQISKTPLTGPFAACVIIHRKLPPGYLHGSSTKTYRWWTMTVTLHTLEESGTYNLTMKILETKGIVNRAKSNAGHTEIWRLPVLIELCAERVVDRDQVNFGLQDITTVTRLGVVQHK